MLQSLFLAAIGEGRDRGAAAIEAFAYRYVEGESAYERFRVHKTVFPADFLEDFGFRIVRSSGRVGLARLELGGLVPVLEGPAREGAAGAEGSVPAGAGVRHRGRSAGVPTPLSADERWPPLWVHGTSRRFLEG